MPDPTDPVAIAPRYADAYAAFDTSELLDVLAPNLRFRQVNPGGYLELDSAQAYIDTTKVIPREAPPGAIAARSRSTAPTEVCRCDRPTALLLATSRTQRLPLLREQ